MSAPAPSVPEPPSPKPRRILWKVVGIGCVLIGIGVTTVWQMRVRLGNQLLAAQLPQFPATFEGMEWKNGGVEFTNLVVKTKSGETPILRLDSAHLELSPLAAARGEFGVISLQGANVELKQEFWKQLSAPSATPQTVETAPSSGTKFSFQGIRVRDSNVDVITESGEHVVGKFTWTGGPLAVHADGSMQAGRQEISINELKAGLNATQSEFDAAAVELDFSSEAKGRKLIVHRLKTGPLNTKAGLALWHRVNAPAEPQEVNASGKPMFESFVIESAEVGPLDFAMEDLPWAPWLPKVTGRIQATVRDVETLLTALPSRGEVEIALSTVIAGPSDQPWINIPALSLRAGAGRNGAIQLHALDCQPASFDVDFEKLQFPGLPQWTVRGEMVASAKDIQINPETIISTVPQELGVTNFSVRVKNADHDLLSWERLSIAAKAEEIAAKRLRKIVLEQPKLDLRGSDLGSLPASESEVAGPVDSAQPSWFGWTVDVPVIRGGSLSAMDLGPGLPNVSGIFGMQPVGDLWTTRLSEVMISTPDFPQAPPLFRGKELLVEIDPARLWRDRRIERVLLVGSRVQVGVTNADSQIPESLQENLTEAPALTSATEIDLQVPPADWHLGALELENTKIFLHNLVPDVSEILIPLSKKTFRNLPLTADGLRQSEQSERIELPFVYVPGTRVGTSVADLDTNFVHFSLAGLMRKEIDQVELVNPKIYVGDSLFHYVDKIRSQAAAPEPAPALPQTVTELRSLMSSLVSMLAGDAPMAPTEAGWTIDRVKAVNGKLITTVKDSPLFRVPPLPFGADSSVKQGQINAQLAVPPGIYKPVLGLELVTSISEGSIVFNLPMKQRDNNLVQVFRANWVRFKQFRIADVTLQVTYDKNGVYTKLWAKGYQGDLEGEFNLYLDDNMSWDMWLTGTNIETKDITDKLTPAYFAMNGKIDFKLIAQGDKNSLYQATGGFKNRESGKIKVLAMDDLISSLPDDWGEAERKWVTKLMEVLRDFSYDKCESELKFYGLEGQVKLKLKGPDGERNFEVNSHDRRLKPVAKSTIE